MLHLTRDVARAFRALVRKCVNGRPRGPAPIVVLRRQAGTLLIVTRTESAVLVHSSPAGGEDEMLAFPISVLADIEGADAGPVELAAGSRRRGSARWTSRGIPRSIAFDIQPADRVLIPALPEAWHPAPAELLTALHECGRMATRDTGRFALDHLQVRGQSGQVIGTDSKRALLWGGFTFPFADDLLVPAIPVFGEAELARASDIRLGLTATDLVLAAGPWTVLLPLNRTARYPDVASVLPKAGAGSSAEIDEGDAGELLAALATLPGNQDEDRPVTLDLENGVTVRGRDGASGAAGEARLARSTSSGPPVRLALDRQAIERALALGCRSIRTDPAGKVVTFMGANRTFAAATLDPSWVVDAARKTTRAATRERKLPPAAAESSTTDSSRRPVMKPHETNGHAPETAPTGELDPLIEAEALRTALGEVVARATRLIMSLKQTRREKKALESVWSSLRQLKLGP